MNTILLSIIINGGNYISIDLSNFKWEVYENWGPIRNGQASGGRKYCPDIKRKCKTPIGVFKILSKKGQFYRSPLYPVGCYNTKGSTKLCSLMPYAVKFKHSGESLHGANDNWDKPFHRSHGCVHMKRRDIKWINQKFPIRFPVIVLPY